MTGFRILLGKELREQVRTRRLLVVGALFLVIGMLSPLTARYLPEILEATLGDELTVPLPVPTAAMALDQLLGNIGQLGALASIALAMGLVAGELDRGTAAFVLTQPASRSAFLLAKLTALALVLGVATLVAVLVGWAYTAILFETLPLGGWLVLAVLAWLSLMAWAGITFLASAVTGSSTAAAGIGFVALIGLSLAAIVPVVDRLLPTGLVVPALQIASAQGDAVDGGRLASALVGTLTIIAGSAAAAVGVFRRREL